jgi:hypothetical protein
MKLDEVLAPEKEEEEEEEEEEERSHVAYRMTLHLSKSIEFL